LLLCLSTFHSAKGCEKKVVICFGFDANYFVYFDKENPDPTKCPCTLYVAATRACEVLCVLGEGAEGEQLPFIDRPRLEALAREGPDGSPPAVVIHKDESPPKIGFLAEAFMYPSAPAPASTAAPVSSPAPVPVPSPGESDPPLEEAAIPDSLAALKRLREQMEEIEFKDVGATDLVRWLTDKLVQSCKKLLSPIRLATAGSAVKLPSTAPGTAGKEDVSDFNGLAIPAMLEVLAAREKADALLDSSSSSSNNNNNNSSSSSSSSSSSVIAIDPRAADKANADTVTCTMYDLLKEAAKSDLHPTIKEKLRSVKKPRDLATPDDFLFLAAVYQAGAGIGRKGYISRVVQLERYDWMTHTAAARCLEILRRSVTDYREAQFEYLMVEEVVGSDGKGITLQGQADILTPTVLWEVKCVSELTDEHFLQLAVYAWLWRRTCEVCALK
jgi:hypothetical protein